MKVFISHQQKDSYLAKSIKNKLAQMEVPSYLDELDHYIYDSNKDLTLHIKSKMHECTDLLVVMTSETKNSWWVPFEIGMAADRNYPTVTYKTTKEKLPDYLSFWPQISSLSDLVLYKSNVLLREQKMSEYQKDRKLFESLDLGNYYQEPNFVLDFYSQLKSDLSSKKNFSFLKNRNN